MPAIVRLLGDAHLPDRIDPVHPLPHKPVNPAQLGDNLFGWTNLVGGGISLNQLLQIPCSSFSHMCCPLIVVVSEDLCIAAAVGTPATASWNLSSAQCAMPSAVS